DKVRIDFIVDNAGFELIGDLCLADFLLATNAAEKVYLHLKTHPVFVSDAMGKDIRYTIEFLDRSIDLNVKAFAERLKNYIDNDRLVCRENQFWTSPLAFWEMPDSLYAELVQSSLILVKGDANYRRTLGDRHWPYTISYQDVTSYFP
ncbi:damage-control phosphatase ARMT1 family protein, partial [Klebsiella pneumoniae]|uniref:damage-control phosphatase ARMT1 family protein n=1 Tax=Klebsiella pneumoniae TaxID=573 RepID=UPI0021CE5991